MTPLELGKLLCYCLSLETDVIEAERFEPLSDADWQDLVQLAASHNLVPLFYRRLKALGAGVAVPPDIWRTLQETYLDSSGTSMRLYNQLGGVLRTLQAESVPVIVLKGAYLAHVVYGNPALRPMQDLDLLVRRGDLARVEEHMALMAYSPRKLDVLFTQDLHHICYMLKDGDLPVEIHWDIQRPTAPFNVDLVELWTRARPIKIAGCQALALSPEDLLLHLCLHAAYHHSFDVGLKALCDIAETIRCYRDKVDWRQVERCARQWGATNCIYLTLYLAHKLLGAAVPDEVLHSLKPGDFDMRFVCWAEGRIFAPADGAARPEFDNWGRWGKARGLGGKVSVLLRACFPPERYLAERYLVSPNSLRIYLYYPLYLMCLVLEHARRAWRLLCGDGETKDWIEQQARKHEQQAQREAEAEPVIEWMASA